MTRCNGLWVGVLLCAWLSACSTTPPRLSATNSTLPALELNATPFFPQEIYQCGPAALATVLQTAGVATATPESLAPQVYLPARRGSLQLELLAATRRAGRAPFVMTPTAAALYSEISAGHPVLVLQNLGLSWWPKWHYAVVIGIDPSAQTVTLRSGTDPRRLTDLTVFERTWKRSGHWALVVTPPGTLPATAQAATTLETLAGLERVSPTAALPYYETATQRWPEHALLALGLGNTRYALGDVAGASVAFETATRHAPHNAAAWNNYAHVLRELGNIEQARHAAARAVSLGGADNAIYAATQHEAETAAPLQSPGADAKK